jgi:hypothetical protein
MSEDEQEVPVEEVVEETPEETSEEEEVENAILEEDPDDEVKISLPIASICLAVLPFILYTICLNASGGSLKQEGGAAQWCILSAYYITTIGFILGVLSLSFAFAALRTRYKGMAIISLLIKATYIIILGLTPFLGPEIFYEFLFNYHLLIIAGIGIALSVMLYGIVSIHELNKLEKEEALAEVEGDIEPTEE